MNGLKYCLWRDLRNMINVKPVILCGGSGTRLWPLSRAGFPKQFLCLTGEESLFQQAALRMAGLGNKDIQISNPLIITGEEHRFIVAEQLREAGISLASLLLEPVGRNTAPALTLAAHAAMQNDQDPVLVVTPADQTLTDLDSFTQTMRQAIAQAELGSIVILGITPTRPEIGFGYIQVELDDYERCGDEVISAQFVKRFTEKPDSATAKQYLAEGGYYWNAGIFVLKASIWLQTLELFRPDIAQATAQAWAARTADNGGTPPFIRPGKVEFAAIPSESIDYAVMERCPSSSQPICMLPMNVGWSDLGAWDAVWEVLPKDQYGNSNVGDVLHTESHNNLVYASNRLVSLVGVSDLVVIETPDAVMVASKAESQKVKDIVDQLSGQSREEQILHRKVHRPWGWFDSIDEGGRFKVKRIQVNPGASLSLQKHYHRAEHWIVVRGTAQIINGSQELTLTENQSTYIPLGEVHRLVNPGLIPLEIIEVQTGSFLGENDIIRYDDFYKRK